MNEILTFLSPELGDTHIVGALLWVCVLALGFVSGILTGLFGVGGGFLVVPLLDVLIGVSYPVTIGSSVSMILGTSAAGLPKHYRQGNVDLGTGSVLIFSSILGAFLGELIQDWLILHVARGDAASFQTLMRMLFVGLLAVIAWLVFRPPPKRTGGLSPVQRFPVGPRVNLRQAGLADVSVTAMSLIGLLGGLTASIFGVGGGILFMPLMILLIGLDAHKAVGTSLLVVFFSTLSAVVMKGLAGKVSLPLAMTMLLGGAIGVQLGIYLCSRFNTRRLKKSFGYVVIFAMLLLIARLAYDQIRG